MHSGIIFIAFPLPCVCIFLYVITTVMRSRWPQLLFFPLTDSGACDASWQLSQSGLIISGFAVSIMTLIFTTAAVVWVYIHKSEELDTYCTFSFVTILIGHACIFQEEGRVTTIHNPEFCTWRSLALDYHLLLHSLVPASYQFFVLQANGRWAGSGN